MKTKIKIIIISTIILLVGVVGILCLNHPEWFYRASEQQKEYMAEINASNTMVYYYGNLNQGKEVTIEYKKVNEFTEDASGDKDNKYKYHMIVIFDLDGKMDVSDEELLLIKKYCEENYYDMLYYGTAHNDQFKKCGFFTKMDTEVDLGFTYNGSYWMNRVGKEEHINPYLLMGIWMRDDEKHFDSGDRHMMWQFAIQYIRQLIVDSKA